MNKEDFLPLSHEEAFAQVATSKYVYMTDDLNFKANFAKDCNLYMIPKRYLQTPSGMGVQKGSPLGRIINYQ